MHIHHTKLRDGNVSFNTRSMKPLFNRAEAMIIGTPSVVTSPVGNGIRFTTRDSIGYKFPVSEPWPCPFDIDTCRTGLTLGIWFRWEYVVSSYYRRYITLGDAFSFYRRSTITSNMVSLRWNFDRELSRFSGFFLVPGKWQLVSWMLNHTHQIDYLDGLKIRTRKEIAMKIGSDITNELHFNKNLDAGNFSVGQIQLWSGRKSPVFMWRLYQQGLPDDQK